MFNLPPDTGASINTAPIFSAAAAISFETDGSMVLESMSREPFFTFLLSNVHNLESDLNPGGYYQACIERNQSILENAIGSSVHVYDIGTRGEHGNNAVSLVCNLSRIIHNLRKQK